MFCKNAENGEDSTDTLDEWDDGSCEKSDDYSGYNKWACTAMGVVEQIYDDDKCSNKVSQAFYAWNNCYRSLDGEYFLKYAKNWWDATWFDPIMSC